uniref:Uncharacterized protein n=1 Tax=Megaselia scalaris TaxID=36166 RepID=T1GJR3_MEGSC
MSMLIIQEHQMMSATLRRSTFSIEALVAVTRRMNQKYSLEYKIETTSFSEAFKGGASSASILSCCVKTLSL